MPVTVQCPHLDCGRSFDADDASIGRLSRCAHCGQDLFIRAAPNAESRETPNGTPCPGVQERSFPRIGRFTVRARLGTGAFGTVFLARDPQLDRDVALKVPNPGVLDSPKRVERFLREARAAAQLRHPNIVAIFDAGQDDDTYYIASAFIQGQPLSVAIGEQGVHFRRAARIVRDLAAAVAYAHGQGIVHRDIKPANVMLDQKDQPHLMDFGLAVRTEEAGKLTADGVPMGTPTYMAPEQAAGRHRELRPSADQYALGIVLYELLTGHAPFEGPPQTVIYHTIHTTPPSPRCLRPEVPVDLATICLKALAKRPEDRYWTCLAFVEDLDRFLKGEPISARRLNVAQRLERWIRREPRVATGLLAALGAIVVSVVLAIVQEFRVRELNNEVKRLNNEIKRLNEQNQKSLR